MIAPLWLIQRYERNYFSLRPFMPPGQRWHGLAPLPLRLPQIIDARVRKVVYAQTAVLHDMPFLEVE